MSVAGCLMRVPDVEVRRHIIESVKSFYSCVAPKELLDGMDCHLQPKTRTFHSENRFSRLSLSEAPLSYSCGMPVCLIILSFNGFQQVFNYSFILVLSFFGSVLVPG